MRAIFINAVDRKVEEVQIENKLETFYSKIGCEMIQVLHLGRTLLIVDEEGRLRDWKVGFRIGQGEGIAGNALLVGEDPEEEDFTDCRLPIDLIVEMTHFLDLEKTPLPPPAFGFAPLPDLSPEGIEKARAEALRDLEQHR